MSYNFRNLVRSIISHMNLPTLQFPLLAIALLFLALLILMMLSGAPLGAYFAFAPALGWGIVLALKGRR